MPYRRLPNTDSARLKALKTADDKAKGKSPIDKPFSQATQYKLSAVISKFEGLVTHRKEAFNHQKVKSSDYHSKFKKAKNYISHFLQVLNLAVIRGDLKNDARTFYHLKKDATKIPTLRNERDIIKWGEIIKKGEAERIMKGGNPMTNPTVGIVTVHYERFLAAYQNQKTLQEKSSRTSYEVAGVRAEVDAIILSLWNEIEEHFSNLNEIEKRNACRQYGINYFFRRSEEIDEKENVPESYRKNRVKDKVLIAKENEVEYHLKEKKESENKNRLVQFSLF